MSRDMHPAAAATIRAELAAIGSGRSRLQQRQRRVRVTSSLVAVAALAVTTSAAALVAAGLPGSTAVTALGVETTGTHTGPALVDVGRAPEGARAVIVDLTCLNDVGMLNVPTIEGGMGLSCRGNSGGTVHIPDGRLPSAGTTAISIEASSGTQWKATVQYASAVTSEWAVNARGQTYGVENATGHPDLVPATADNGRKGWALWSEWYAAEKSGTVNVYESDGSTVIGHSEVVVGADEVPVDQRYIDDLQSVETTGPTSSPTP